MSYVLKPWERWDNDRTLHIPQFCPACGAKLRSQIQFWVDSHRRASRYNPFRGVGYDCACSMCDWTGDIIPDEDRDIVMRYPPLYHKFCSGGCGRDLEKWSDTYLLGNDYDLYCPHCVDIICKRHQHGIFLRDLRYAKRVNFEC